MASKGSRRPTERQVLTSGPWKAVQDTIDPFDDNPESLVDAVNTYIADPQSGSGVYARAGFSPQNTPSGSLRGQAIYTHHALDGTAFSFIVMKGAMYRVTGTPGAMTFTTVTPAAPIAIDDEARVKMVSLGDDLIVSDGENPPWIAGTLGATPITGTYIDFDGAATDWTAQDITVWGGSLVAALKTVNNVARQDDIAWSEPGTPAIGWFQTDFDNVWTIEQTGSAPIYAILGTNVSLLYFRAHSIGAISGAIGPDLATTSTHDAISFNVGTQSPQSVQTFGDRIFFCDALGRPWMMQIGGPPVPIWLNMRAIVDAQNKQFPVVTAQTITTTYEPVLNLWLAAIWSPIPDEGTSPTELYAFDARSGAYVGRWIIGGGPVGISIDCLGVFLGQNNEATLVLIGSLVAGGSSGYVWTYSSLEGAPLLTSTVLKTQGTPTVRLTTEAGVRLVLEAETTAWLDNGEVPTISVTTNRLGYSADTVWNVDRCTVIAGSDAPSVITLQTPTTAATVIGTPTPAASLDGTFRSVAGCQTVGRGVQVTVAPTTARTQWVLHRVQIVATPSTARPEDA